MPSHAFFLIFLLINMQQEKTKVNKVMSILLWGNSFPQVFVVCLLVRISVPIRIRLGDGKTFLSVHLVKHSVVRCNDRLVRIHQPISLNLLVKIKTDFIPSPRSRLTMSHILVLCDRRLSFLSSFFEPHFNILIHQHISALSRPWFRHHLKPRDVAHK